MRAELRIGLAYQRRRHVGSPAKEEAEGRCVAAALIGFDELVFVPMIPTIDQVQRLLDLNL